MLALDMHTHVRAHTHARTQLVDTIIRKAFVWPSQAPSSRTAAGRAQERDVNRRGTLIIPPGNGIFGSPRGLNEMGKRETGERKTIK